VPKPHWTIYHALYENLGDTFCCDTRWLNCLCTSGRLWNI